MINFVIHYHEIALKKGNRRLFVNKLIENIKVACSEYDRRACSDLVAVSVKNLPGRLLLGVGHPSVGCPTPHILAKIPGIANFMEAFQVPADMDSLKEAVWEEIKDKKFKNFRISTKRADKSFPLTSEDVNKELGAWVKEKSGAAVNLEDPKFTVFVEVLRDKIFFGFEKIPGVGGLPAGSSGTAVSLLSGGIDSPVASFMMMKRGCRLVFVHFHSHPYLDRSSQDKVLELMKVLDLFQYNSRLYIVGFGDIQKEIVLKVPEAYRVIVYRRVMVRIANAIAEKERAGAIVTGENLGQVASQTMENISVAEEASKLTIFRPLLGMDKQEIVDMAKKIGTYDISILPDQDCCQLFTPKHPATKSDIKTIEKLESKLDVQKMIADALKSAEIKDY